jgi:hypothetical protein
MGKLRRRELVPEDTPVVATINEPKLVHGQYGRQIQAQIRIVEGDYRGTEFRTWFSFGKDKDNGEEFIPYGGPLYRALSITAPNIDEVLDDENLTEKKYQQWVKKAANNLDGVKIMARVGIKVPKNNPDKKSNTLQPGTIGAYEDPDADFEDIDMGNTAEEVKAPF